MDSGFASQMISAVESLANGFSTFTGGTITESVWNGAAADNAKNQVTEKIDPRVEEVKEKLNNLINAIQEAENARAAQANVAEAERCIEQVRASNVSDEQKSTEISQFEADKDRYQDQYEQAKNNVISLCS